jgi:tRNA (uracil-5-)-methyltransferase TRM9
MRPEIADRIRELSREFYSQFAGDFSATRQRIQPGVQRILEEVRPDASILDLGCGNGSIARSLAEQGHHGSYAGIDSSHELITIARTHDTHPQARYTTEDLALDAWHKDLAQCYSEIFSFATIHHIAGKQNRLHLLKLAAGFLAPHGRMVVSVWNFLASERYRSRILPWPEFGFKESDVEPGDYLLDWRRGGRGIRYVHHFSEEELSSLGRMAGLETERSFYSDGKNGILGLYQVWKNIKQSHPAYIRSNNK